MSTAIAFLSGKGGSGKTTLALSIADLMSKCKIKTLLIDCDLSTNGATYFFESYLAGNATSDETGILSFYDYLRVSDSTHSIYPTRIDTFFGFLPSISSISADSNQLPLAGIAMHIDELRSKLRKMITTAKEIYDVILCDCQAGYTELLSGLLPLMDVDIFVLEADSISASAMRNLHLKTGGSLGHAKLYQVFNKASEEEYETYSKIVGTFFTNIGTLLFDWKIRQAFSRSQIPDLGNVSAKYGADLCEICKVILIDGEIQKKLNSFSKILNYQQLEEEKITVEKKLDDLIRSPYSPRKKYSYVFYTVALVSVMLSVFGTSRIVSRYSLDNSDTWLVLGSIVAAVCLLAVFSTITVFFGGLREDRNIRHLYERRIQELSERMRRLRTAANDAQIDEKGYNASDSF